MKADHIVQAASAVLAREGLAGWTVDKVAREAGCAKGLVHYHHHTKHELLVAVATQLAEQRHQRRRRALGIGGTAALDRLFDILLAEVRSGEAAAWLALCASRQIQELNLPDPTALGPAFATALGLEPLEPHAARAIAGTLDGLQIQLLTGARPADVREAYHRFWLRWI